MLRYALAALTCAACLIGGGAQANDRDLLGTPVPAASCVKYYADNAEGGALNSGRRQRRSWYNGVFALRGGVGTPGQDYKDFRLHCGLAVNQVEISNLTSNDNDITSFRVLYRDGDGRGAATVVEVTLYKMTALSSGEVQSTPVCQWSSNTSGTGATGYIRATVPCAHDIPVGAFYHFDVRLFTTAIATRSSSGSAELPSRRRAAANHLDSQVVWGAVHDQRSVRRSPPDPRGRGRGCRAGA